jgi:hypothetical protein
MVADSVAASTVGDLGLELPARRAAANHAGGSPRTSISPNSQRRVEVSGMARTGQIR